MVAKNEQSEASESKDFLETLKKLADLFGNPKGTSAQIAQEKAKKSISQLMRKLIQEHNLEPARIVTPLPEYCTPEWFAAEQLVDNDENKYRVVKRWMLITVLTTDTSIEKIARLVDRTTLSDLLVEFEDFPGIDVVQWLIENRSSQKALQYLTDAEEILLATITLFQKDLLVLRKILFPYIPNGALYQKSLRLWCCIQVCENYKDFVQTYADSFETTTIID
jgi:hypothetical protein